MSKNLVEVLMERDELTKQEAEEMVEEVRQLIAESDPWEAEDILMDELGLELDYIFDLI